MVLAHKPAEFVCAKRRLEQVRRIRVWSAEMSLVVSGSHEPRCGARVRGNRCGEDVVSARAEGIGCIAALAGSRFGSIHGRQSGCVKPCAVGDERERTRYVTADADEAGR